MTLTFIMGWLGTILYLLNHAYISFVHDWKKSVYYGGNLLAAVLLTYSSMQLASYQAVITNLFWGVISILMLMGIRISYTPFGLKGFLTLFAGFLGTALLALFRPEIAVTAIFAWSSAFVFSAAYLLFCAGRLNPVLFFSANVYAALAILPQLWLDGNIAVFFLEVVWALISFYAAIKRYQQVHLID